MRGSVSIEVLLLAVLFFSAILLMGQVVSRTIGVVQSVDPVLMGRAAGTKLMAGILQSYSCRPCEINASVYVPLQGRVEIEGGMVRVYVEGDIVFEGNAPVINDINVGEGWHTLRLRGTSQGVEIG